MVEVLETSYSIGKYKEKSSSCHPYTSYVNYYGAVKAEPFLTVSQPYYLKSSISFKFLSKYKFELPLEFDNLVKAIQKSESILELADNWDNEDSKSYSEITLLKSINFLTRCAIKIQKDLGILIKTPHIFPGQNGSIDLLWNNCNSTLLINFPEGNNNIASFYGDDQKNSFIEGKFDFSKNNMGIIVFLKDISTIDYVGK